MARVRRAPEPAQLDLFGAKPAEVVVPMTPQARADQHLRDLHDATKDYVRGLNARASTGALAGPMTAAESERAFTGNEYLGFCTTDGRCTCRACLDRLGADAAKDGSHFFHYLWPPRRYQVAGGEPVVDFKLATCRHCGLRFDVEPCAFKLEPPAA